MGHKPWDRAWKRAVGKFGDRFDEASRVFRAPVSGRYQLTWTQRRGGKWSLQAVLLDDDRRN